MAYQPSPAQLATERHLLGLDQPLPLRYLHWVAGAVRGNLGTSFASGQPVTTELASRRPATLRLATLAALFTVGLALAAALTAAWAEGTWVDAALRGAALSVCALPSFVAGMLVLRFVVVGLGWGKVVADGSWHAAVLPALCVALLPAGQLSRLLRAGLVRFMATPAAFVAAARGATRGRILLVHALPNAALPTLAVLGVTLAYLLGGTAVIEAVFTWPGVGQFLVASLKARDLPVLQGFTVLATASFVTISLAVDAASALIDPRLRATA